MKTKTYPGMVIRVGKEIGPSIAKHTPTPENRLGQSGMHTMVDDIIGVVMASDSEAHAYKLLHEYFTEGSVEIKDT